LVTFPVFFASPPTPRHNPELFRFSERKCLPPMESKSKAEIDYTLMSCRFFSSFSAARFKRTHSIPRFCGPKCKMPATFQLSTPFSVSHPTIATGLFRSKYLRWTNSALGGTMPLSKTSLVTVGPLAAFFLQVCGPQVKHVYFFFWIPNSAAFFLLSEI